MVIHTYLFIFPLSNPEPPTFRRLPGEMREKEPWEQMRLEAWGKVTAPSRGKDLFTVLPLCFFHLQQTVSECLSAQDATDIRADKENVILP